MVYYAPSCGFGLIVLISSFLYFDFIMWWLYIEVFVLVACFHWLVACLAGLLCWAGLLSCCFDAA